MSPPPCFRMQPSRAVPLLHLLPPRPRQVGGELGETSESRCRGGGEEDEKDEKG
jgi:hypothetical protein